uniref:E3 ubiquitin-protein ligase WAV3-like n=1 Tax=Elaeis guineensis var. tenera TaxID=51953 RepID=A0A8N4F0Q7_ELAGV|nr:E3 ubiquitin-protein ligase WAV3-like [Elaeis guineensis]
MADSGDDGGEGLTNGKRGESTKRRGEMEELRKSTSTISATGIRILKERCFRNPVASIILLSDGIDTMDRFSLTGRLQSSRQTRDFLQRLPPSARSVGPVHSFGFDANDDPTIMHAVAEATGGTFSFVEEEAAVSDAFAACLAGLLSVVAQYLHLTICSASPGVHLTSVGTGNYLSRISDQRLMAVIEVGDLYAEEEKYFLLDVTMKTEELERQRRVMQKKRKALATAEESSKHPRIEALMAQVVPSPTGTPSRRFVGSPSTNPDVVVVSPMKILHPGVAILLSQSNSSSTPRDEEAS